MGKIAKINNNSHKVEIINDLGDKFNFIVPESHRDEKLKINYIKNQIKLHDSNKISKVTKFFNKIFY
jgi:hypothetical protein